MFAHFQTEHGHLYVRVADLLRVEDTDRGTWVVWLENGQAARARISEKAQEAFERLKREEEQAAAEAERRQQRQANGMPLVPISRGKVRP